MSGEKEEKFDGFGVDQWGVLNYDCSDGWTDISERKQLVLLLAFEVNLSKLKEKFSKGLKSGKLKKAKKEDIDGLSEDLDAQVRGKLTEEQQDKDVKLIVSIQAFNVFSKPRAYKCVNGKRRIISEMYFNFVGTFEIVVADAANIKLEVKYLHPVKAIKVFCKCKGDFVGAGELIDNGGEIEDYSEEPDYEVEEEDTRIIPPSNGEEYAVLLDSAATDIDGIGPALAKKLKVKTLRDLMSLDPRRVKGISKEKLVEYQNKADLLTSFPILTKDGVEVLDKLGIKSSRELKIKSQEITDRKIASALKKVKAKRSYRAADVKRLINGLK